MGKGVVGDSTGWWPRSPNSTQAVEPLPIKTTSNSNHGSSLATEIQARDAVDVGKLVMGRPRPRGNLPWATDLPTMARTAAAGSRFRLGLRFCEGRRTADLKRRQARDVGNGDGVAI
ncbi:hypothetical protein TIFTF001_000879 [Ficus carica]|uniref:Uncharacterized protein n=1 Tax=Ficus carica TaxID=3494 RepID=A0AA87ZD08_FICCA|nr:hypothetical protein TIFTF001_000879 [Ficus carica]